MPILMSASPTTSHQASAAKGGATNSTPVSETLERRLCIPLKTPLICGPPKLRRSRTPAPVSLRRSERIAAAPREQTPPGRPSESSCRSLGWRRP